MADFLTELEEARGRLKYDYIHEMAPEIEAWIIKKMPFLAAGLGIGIADRYDAYETVYGRLMMTDDYKTFGLGYRGRLALAQWQYKDMVKRSGPESLIQACDTLGVKFETIIHAMFTNDWKSIDEVLRYHYLGKAVMMAVDSIADKGVAKE